MFLTPSSILILVLVPLVGFLAAKWKETYYPSTKE